MADHAFFVPYQFLMASLCLLYERETKIVLSELGTHVPAADIPWQPVTDCALQVRSEPMLDLIYLLIGTVFFVGCWAFTKACDRL